MGLTIYFMVAVIATANAGFVWSSARAGNNDNFPAFPTFPSFPKLTFPKFPTFPTFPTFPPIVTPSKHDIINNDNPNFSGTFISSSSSSRVGTDGKVHQTGGTTIVTKEGGVVKEYKIGDNPPDDESQPEITMPQIHFWQPIEPLIPDHQLLKAYKPIDKNEHFYGTSATSFIQSSNVNGVRNDFGGTNIISNVDGVVSEKSSHIQTNDN